MDSVFLHLSVVGCNHIYSSSAVPSMLLELVVFIAHTNNCCAARGVAVVEKLVVTSFLGALSLSDIFPQLLVVIK